MGVFSGLGAAIEYARQAIPLAGQMPPDVDLGRTVGWSPPETSNVDWGNVAILVAVVALGYYLFFGLLKPARTGGSRSVQAVPLRQTLSTLSTSARSDAQPTTLMRLGSALFWFFASIAMASAACALIYLVIYGANTRLWPVVHPGPFLIGAFFMAAQGWRRAPIRLPSWIGSIIEIVEIKMLGTGAILLSAYAGYAGWPWWLFTALGAVVGFQVANSRMHQSPLRGLIDSGDRDAGNTLFKALVLGVASGSALMSIAYGAGVLFR